MYGEHTSLPLSLHHLFILFPYVNVNIHLKSPHSPVLEDAFVKGSYEKSTSPPKLVCLLPQIQ